MKFDILLRCALPPFKKVPLSVQHNTKGSLLSIYLLILSINLLIYELLCYFSFFSLMFSPNADCTRAEIVTLKNLIF